MNDFDLTGRDANPMKEAGMSEEAILKASHGARRTSGAAKTFLSATEYIFWAAALVGDEVL